MKNTCKQSFVIVAAGSPEMVPFKEMEYAIHAPNLLVQIRVIICQRRHNSCRHHFPSFSTHSNGKNQNFAASFALSRNQHFPFMTETKNIHLAVQLCMLANIKEKKMRNTYNSAAAFWSSKMRQAGADKASIRNETGKRMYIYKWTQSSPSK